MRNTFLVIFLIVVSRNANAQSPDSIIKRYFSLYPNEQVYLQPDNDFYFPGDTVWYKVYVTDNGVPSFRTKSLYVDWFDVHGVRIAHQVLPVVSGMAKAQYALPASLSGKKAHVIAYTRWMLNDSRDFVFHKDLALIQQTNSKPGERAAGGVTSNPELRFYPEGGSLVGGVVNKVAFRAARKDGSGEEVKGVIRDNEGHSVTSFSSDGQGMGYFYLLPAAEVTYTADWGVTTPLPPARPGMAMEVRSAQNERIVTLRRSVGLGGRYWLMGTFYGGVTYLAKINLTTLDTAVLTIPVGGYLDGTLTLSVLDSAWTPVCERILFIQGQDSTALQSRINLSIKQKGLSARGQNRILLSYTGTSAASLSIAAADAALPEDKIPGIVDYLTGVNAAGDPDLLALTGEWKHNDWKAILTQQPPQNKYAADTSYYVLGGKAVNSTGKKEQLQFVINQRGLVAVDTLELSQNGIIADTSMILFDTTWILYQPDPNQKQYTFLFDQPAPPAWDNYPFPDEPGNYPLDKKQEASLTFADTADLSKRFGKTLQTVTVTAAKRVNRMDSLENLYESEMMKHSEGYLWDLHGESPNTNFSFFLRLLADNVPDFPSRRYNGFHPPPISKYTYLVDENVVPFLALSQGAFPQIVFVKYFPAGQLAFGTYPCIAMYTEKYGVIAKKKGNMAPDPNEYFVAGYTQSQPFDTLTWRPAATKARAADLRRTLYWNPSVFVDGKNNSIQLTFANNDLGGPIRIVVEGMDEDGNPIHVEKIIRE